MNSFLLIEKSNNGLNLKMEIVARPPIPPVTCRGLRKALYSSQQKKKALNYSNRIE